jgi:hypothetical protein
MTLTIVPEILIPQLYRFQVPHVEITRKLHNLRTQRSNGMRKIKKKNLEREPMMWCSLQIGSFSIPYYL